MRQKAPEAGALVLNDGYGEREENVFAGWIGRESCQTGWEHKLQRRGYGSDVACDDEKERAEVVLPKHAAGARHWCRGSLHKVDGIGGFRGPDCGDPERRCRHCVMPEKEQRPVWT